MRRLVAASACLCALTLIRAGAQTSETMSYPAGVGPGAGRHVVLISGDEEYRSEEALPMLAKILSRRLGFRTTVLFALDPDGTINPNNGKSLAGSTALDTADLILLSVRFRAWPDEDMTRFERAYLRGTPIVALRTSTHPFSGFGEGSPWRKWNYNNQGGFGRQVFGETWVSHWGRHKIEATRGVIEPARRDHPMLRGVTSLFGDTDVYEAYPPDDADVLVRGIVLQTLAVDSQPATYQKTRARDKASQDVNTPAMPVVWTRLHTNEAQRTNRIVMSTMGSATDFEDEGLRRLVVNAVFWGLSLDVPAKADVTFVDPYRPSFYGFDGFRKGLRPSDFALGKEVPGTPLPRPQVAK
jgi:hypothetical protein